MFDKFSATDRLCEKSADNKPHGVFAHLSTILAAL